MIDTDFLDKCTKKTVIKVSHWDINALVDKYMEGFDEPFHMTDVENLPRFSFLNVEIIKGGNDAIDKSMISPINGKYQKISTKPILTYLCDNGIIEPGEYLINTCGD